MRADLGAPLFDFGFDGIADFASAGEVFVVAILKGGGVGEAPMQAGGDTGKDGATFGAGFIANGDDVGEDFAGFEHVEDGFG